MKFLVSIDVMPHEELLDPQGKAVVLGLHNMGIHAAENVRLGKHIQMEINAETEEHANELVESACRELLTNPVVEFYTYSIKNQELKTN